MDIAGKVAVVTGGASGIGRALATRLAERGAAGVVVADIEGDHAASFALSIGGLGVQCDVGDPDSIIAAVAAAEAALGPVDIFCSNAGYSDPDSVGLSTSPTDFRRLVDVNLLAHVWAAQAVVPAMLERGGGYLLQTLSATALITGPCAPGYALTKHGALGFAEWLTLQYGHRGLRVSCLCPNAVYTPMFGAPVDDLLAEPPAGVGFGEILRPLEVADFVIDAMADERFLILPHPRVGESFARKGADYDLWLEGTRRRLLKGRVSVEPASQAGRA